MRRASPWFAGVAVCVGLVFAALAFTDDPHLSDGVRFAAALTIWVSLILAVAFAIRGFVILWNMSNGRLSLQPTGTDTIGGGVQYVPFPLLRLKFENKGTPGDFHAKAWWVDGGERSDEEWDVCWRNTDQSDVHIDDEKVMNLIGLVGPTELARPIRPSFPLELHTGSRGSDGDWLIEVDVWRTGNKTPIHTWWQLGQSEDGWKLMEASEPDQDDA